MVAAGGKRSSPAANGLGGELRAREVHAGEEHQRCLHELAERLRRRRVTGLPGDQVAELVDVVGRARRAATTRRTRASTAAGRTDDRTPRCR